MCIQSSCTSVYNHTLDTMAAPTMCYSVLCRGRRLRRPVRFNLCLRVVVGANPYKKIQFKSCEAHRNYALRITNYALNRILPYKLQFTTQPHHRGKGWQIRKIGGRIDCGGTPSN